MWSGSQGAISGNAHSSTICNIMPSTGSGNAGSGFRICRCYAHHGLTPAISEVGTNSCNSSSVHGPSRLKLL